MRYLFVVLCWIVGIVGHDEAPADRVKARGKCRDINVKNHEVVVKFTCQEDADLFAKDLKDFIRD